MILGGPKSREVGLSEGGKGQSPSCRVSRLEGGIQSSPWNCLLWIFARGQARPVRTTRYWIAAEIESSQSGLSAANSAHCLHKVRCRKDWQEGIRIPPFAFR